MKRLLGFTPTKPLLVGCLMLGIMIGLILVLYKNLTFIFAIFGFIAIGLSFWKKIFLLIVLLCLGIVIGSWRGESFSNKVTQYQQYYGKNITINAKVSDDAGSNDEGEVEFHVGQIILDDGQTLVGIIRVRTRQKVSITRGDSVIVSGRLNKTLGTSRQGSIAFASVEVTNKNTSLLESSRKSFFRAVEEVVPEPQASLGLGYLIGLRVSIPKYLEDNLSVTGLTHIVAVSGYNLTVIVSASRRLFAKKSAYQSVVFSGSLIVLFLLIAGFSAPISRAALISALSLLAWYYGKNISPILLLMISGAITSLILPFYIWGDVSWYLSFLAFFGVLVFAPLITKRIFKDKQLSIWLQILIETISAQLFALPYLIYLFGSVSIIAPLANLLVLPPTPLIMLGVFIGGAVAIFWTGLASWLIVLPYLLLTYQVWVVEKLSSVSWASYQISTSFGSMIGLYIVLLLFTTILWLSLKRLQQLKGQSAKINWNMV